MRGFVADRAHHVRSNLVFYVPRFHVSPLCRSGQSYWLCPSSPQYEQNTLRANCPLMIASSRICACLYAFSRSSFTTINSRMRCSAAFTSSSFSPVMITCNGSSRPIPSIDSFPSRLAPFPRIRIFVCVSDSSCRCEFPRGPMISPTKL